MKRFKVLQARFVIMMLILSVFLSAGCGSGGGTGHWDSDSAEDTKAAGTTTTAAEGLDVKAPLLALIGLANDIVGNLKAVCSGNDTTSPTVTAVVPLNNATDVTINTKIITVAFNETMDPASLTAASFYLECPSGTPVSGSVTYLAAGNVATLTLPPATDLPANTVCTATVTTGAKDLAGNALAGNFVWTFTTGVAPDITAPTISSTIPVNASPNAAFNTKPTAIFSEEMDPATIATGTFTVTGPGTTSVAGAVTYVVGSRTVVFTPTEVLTASTTYTATITTGAKDLAGNALAGNFVWTFTTGAAPDSTPPTVTLTVPANADTGVLTNTAITATFSEAMDPSTIIAGNFTVTGPGAAPVLGTVTYAGVKATFTPANDLARNTTYTATITTGAKDLANNALASNYTWNFKTTTAIVQSTINENSSPVLSTLIPDQAYVIKDNVNYKLYYAGNDFASINLATSPDGITWTPYSGNPIISDAQYHADVKYYSTGFPGANNGTNPSTLTMNYRMWYQGPGGQTIAGWRYAESPDGINWYNRMAVAQFGTPVIGGNISAQYGIADAVYTPGASNTGTDWTFRIYVNAQYAVSPYSSNELVVMAFSADGYNWTGYDPTSAGYATPVFAPTLDGISFDCDHIGWFKVIKNSPTDWEAFYSGGKGSTYKALNGIGYATSDDGINWTRRQTLFTTSDGVAWRSQSVWMPSVVKSGSNYEIYFLGSDNPNIDSSDWIQWKVGRAILTPIH